MDNFLYLLLYTMAYNDPAIFWLFVAMIIAGVAMTYFYRVNLGVLVTFLISAIFYWISEFSPYILAIVLVSVITLLINLLGFRNVHRKLQNLKNWLYLRYRIRKKRKPSTGALNKNL